MHVYYLYQSCVCRAGEFVDSGVVQSVVVVVNVA